MSNIEDIERFEALTDERILNLYEKALKAHIAFCAAKAEAQEVLSTNSVFDMEVQSGYEKRIDALEEQIVKRDLFVPFEWTKYPRYVDINLVVKVLEYEKAQRIIDVRDMDPIEAKERRNQIELEFDELIKKAVLKALHETNIERKKMLIASQIAKRVLETYGYTESIDLCSALNKRYWDISKLAKSRGCEVIDRPAQDIRVYISDVEYAIEDIKGIVLSNVATADKVAKQAIEALFNRAMHDTKTIKQLLDRASVKEQVLN